MKASEIIREARNVLFERGWHKGDTLGPDGSVCTYGALIAATGEEVQSESVRAVFADEDATGFVERVIGAPIGQWNDLPERTFAEVVDALYRAEKIAEREESSE